MVVLGALTSLSHPPFNYYLINFVTFSILFIFLYKKINQKITKKTSFYFGWIFGFSYFLTNLYWITISLTFDENLSFLIPIAIIVIPAFLGLFYAFVTFFFSYLSKKVF